MAKDAALTEALRRWRFRRVNRFFPPAPGTGRLGSLPQDFISVASERGGCEGFLGETYLRLYRLDELEAANLAYGFERYTPDLVLFGSNGCGDAFAFTLPHGRVVQVPFIPLGMEHAEVVADDFATFVQRLAEGGDSAESNPATLGLEVHEVHPVCLGGDPASPENKAYVPPAQHAELAAYWNQVYARLRGRQGS